MLLTTVLAAGPAISQNRTGAPLPNKPELGTIGERINANTIAVVSGNVNGTYLSIAYDLLNALKFDGFDTWTPDLIDGDLPDGISVVVIVGADWFSRSDAVRCEPTTTVPPTTTSTSLPPVGAVVTTLLPQDVPTTTTPVGC